MKRLIFSMAFIILITALSGLSRARVTGECSNCHTMHNSDGGEPMAYEFSDGSFSPRDTPYEQLLKSDCVGCHTATGSGSTGNVPEAPIVYNTSEPTYGDHHDDGKNIGLAAGNFYYTTAASGASGESRGHSLTCVDFVDNTDTPAGQRTSCGTNDCHHPTGTTGLQAHGCEACHLPAHHKHGASTAIVDSEDGYYRFLGPIRAADGGSDDHVRGVRGYEDDDWQKTFGNSDHNEYSGEADTADYHSISSHCGCHYESTGPIECKAFQVKADPLYHKANLVLPSLQTKWDGYREVSEGIAGEYSPMLPIARSDIATGAYPSAVVGYGANDALMCLTCHRAHASPYDNMLRWDNTLTLGDQGPYYGCIGCHDPEPIVP